MDLEEEEKRDLCFSVAGGNSKKAVICKSGRELATEINIAPTLTLDFQAPEL